MSESQEALSVEPVFGGVAIYRVTLVRESTVAQLPNTPVRKATEASAILRPFFAALDREQFVVLLVDAQHSPIGINIVSIGSLTASIVHPREAFKAAIPPTRLPSSSPTTIRATPLSRAGKTLN